MCNVILIKVTKNTNSGLARQVSIHKLDVAVITVAVNTTEFLLNLTLMQQLSKTTS